MGLRSYIATTYTTSTLITVSPTSIISATTISSCLSINFVAAAVFPLSSSAGSSSSSSISRRTSIDIVNASSTFTSYTIEISPSHSQHKGSSVESSVSTSIALETTSSKTYSNANASALTSSTHVETRPSSSSTRGELPGISSPSNFAHESLRASQHSSRRPMTSQVSSIVSSNIAAVTSQRSWILVSTQVPTFSAEASERMPLGGTSKATSPAHDVDSSSRGLRGSVKVPRSADVGACASWTVMLSHVTAFPTPTTSWSIMTSTTWKTTLMVVPIGTLYKSCPPSVTATPVAATSLSQPETTTTPEAETPGKRYEQSRYRSLMHCHSGFDNIGDTDGWR